MEIRLDSIQPGEEVLLKKNIDFYGKNSEIFLEGLKKIRVYSCKGQPFKYFCMDGNTRLYVAHKKGIKFIEPKKIINLEDVDHTFIWTTRIFSYDEGIRKWEDFDKRIKEDY